MGGTTQPTPLRGLCCRLGFRPAPVVALAVLWWATSTCLETAQGKTSFLSNCCAQLSSGSAFSQMPGGELGRPRSPLLLRGEVAGPPGCPGGVTGARSHQSVPQVVQEKDGDNNSSSVSALTGDLEGEGRSLQEFPGGRFCTSCWGLGWVFRQRGL